MIKSRGLASVLCIAVVFLAQTGCSLFTDAVNPGQDKEQVVHVFSARHYEGDTALFEQFTKQSGIKVIEIKGTAVELIERLKQEGDEGNADVFVAVDGSVMELAKQQGVLQPLQSEVVERQIAKRWRDPNGYWTAIAARARVIVYAKDRVDPELLQSYEDLTAEEWKGRVLVRSSTNLYNQSLLASFIELHGEQQAAAWAKGVAANLARPPEGGDLAQAKAVASGIGDVAIMNAYYIGQLANSSDAEEVRMADRLGIIFPNQETSGTHMNISAAGITKYSKNKENAIKLIEFMTSKQGQTLLANSSYEFPVNKEAELPELLKSWGSFKEQQLQYSRLGEHSERVQTLFNEAKWE